MSLIKTGAYQTYLDLDLTVQGTQTVSADGAFSFAGMTWTKGNSTNEATHLQITSATGVVFKPASTSLYSAGIRTLPYMWLPLNQIGGLAGLNWQSRLRLWANVSVDNCTANADNSVIAIDNNAATLDYVGFRGFNSSQGANGYCGVGSTTLVGSTLTLGAGNRVMMIEIDLSRFAISVFVGSNAIIWPDPSTMSLMGVQVLTNTNLATTGFANPFSTMGILLGAQRNASATSLSITYANLRLDVAQFE
jgi:hypothetical protein